MTARYRLPDALGGGDYDEYRHVDGSTEAPAGTVAFLVDGAIVCVAHVLLKPALPPLPPEPPVGSVVMIRREGGGASGGGWRCVFQHQRRGSSSAWSMVGFGDDYDWARVCGNDTPVLLVPAPEPVELPWIGPQAQVKVGQTRSQIGPGEHVYVAVSGVGGAVEFEHIKPDVAREMARALWTAADAAEAQS